MNDVALEEAATVAISCATTMIVGFNVEGPETEERRRTQEHDTQQTHTHTHTNTYRSETGYEATAVDAEQASS